MSLDKGESDNLGDVITTQTVDESGSKTATILDLEELIPSIEKKGVNTLLPTETLGLKTIRHTLAGLLEGSEDDLSPLLQDKSVDSGNYVDFVALSDSIAEEKRAEFDEMLEKYNETRQQSVELRGFEGAREKWKKLFEKRVAIQNKSKSGTQQTVTYKALDTLLWEWNDGMLPLIKAEFNRIEKVLNYSSLSQIPSEIKKQQDESQNVSYADRFEYGPYITLVKPENLGPITMLELLKLNSTGGIQEGMRTARAVLAVGKTVEMEYRMQVAKQLEKDALKGFDNGQSGLGTVKSAVKNSDFATVQTSWPLQIRAKIGSLLISLLLQVAKVNVYGNDPITGERVIGKAPAFYHSYQYQNGSRVGILKVHKSVAKHLSGEAMTSAIQPQLLPMLVKPRPWTGWNKGGYLYGTTKIMRSRDSPEQVAYLKAASQREGTLDGVYEGLNVLGNTAWTINKEVFEVILKVWNSGEEFLEIPRKVELQPELPPPPPRDADPGVRRDWLRKCRLIVNENQAMYSQRCDTNYKLEIARAYLGERFYLPHNLDFRGRAYPLSPHLNHLGNDLSRGLLKFWESRELGEHGLDWLKIHCANVFGHSKFSFEDRIAFANENIDNIIDSANDPTGGKKWWQEAESPWQALATCIELRNAFKMEDPSKYKCRLPVHMDGSCNGLQHYAALGGDVEGAAEVNLIPSSKPQDVYSRVLEIVRVRVEEDAKKGLKEAELAVDKLSRKLIKQTVMTHVYGVTFVGARQQIANRLSDAGLEQAEIYGTAAYLARTVLGAVRSLFEGAHLIQDWLGDNATRISRSVRLDMGNVPLKSSKNGSRPQFMSSVIWTTPLGLPIVQPYRQDTKKQVITSLQSVFITDPYALRGVNSRKQRTAFPPNFIHSLDATHMLMSAIGCGKAGISFAAVHDSYWTHAGDIDKMNSILRDCFIELHKVDLVDKLRIEFEQRYSGLLQYAEIPKDCETARRIVKAQNRYSLEKYGTEKKLTIGDQVEMENKRLELLENGEEQLHETPVSIIEELSEDELDKLFNQIPKRVRRKKLAKNASYRSTEHVGTGVDKFESLEKHAEEADKEDESIDDLSAMTRSSSLMGILVPLRISKVPEKGEFDVQQLRESKYFFS